MRHSSRPRTISIGGATFDLFVRVDRRFMQESSDGTMLNLPVGAKIRVHEVIETCGGGASNTSVGLQRLGCDAAFSGVVGSDQWGEKLLENLEKEGVNTSGTTVVEGETSSSSIILSVSSGERIILYDPGTNAHLHGVTFDREALADCDWIYLNHLAEDSCVIQGDIVQALENVKRPPGLTWNPGDAQLALGIEAPGNRQLLTHTHLLLLNKEEALSFTHAANVDGAIRACLAAGVRVVCVTDGAEGVTAGDERETCHCPAIHDAPVIDTTGAGDAFGVGATWALARGTDLPTMLRAGTMNATSVLGVIGAQAGLLTDIQMQQRLQTVQLDVRVARA